jgi:ribosomal protein S18 acetylase RimI-like enzyme
VGDAPPLVRPGRSEDLAWIAEILNRSPQAAQWLPESFPFLVAEPRAGFLAWREVSPGEFEILNLAVAPEARRRGVAQALLAAATRPGRWFLEVRESNSAARAFYRQAGFVEVGQRVRYYRDPEEKAIVLSFQSC